MKFNHYVFENMKHYSLQNTSNKVNRLFQQALLRYLEVAKMKKNQFKSSQQKTNSIMAMLRIDLLNRSIDQQKGWMK